MGPEQDPEPRKQEPTQPLQPEEHVHSPPHESSDTEFAFQLSTPDLSAESISDVPQRDEQTKPSEGALSTEPVTLTNSGIGVESSSEAEVVPISLGEKEFEEKARRAVAHYEQWLKNRHPELSDDEIRADLAYVAGHRAVLDYFIDSDEFDDEIMKTHPDWQPWFNRRPGHRKSNPRT